MAAVAVIRSDRRRLDRVGLIPARRRAVRVATTLARRNNPGPRSITRRHGSRRNNNRRRARHSHIGLLVLPGLPLSHRKRAATE
ncbi:phenylacetate-coenzyme A ligase family protein [Mycolicibacterium brisbanense]|uniref:Phenylacetate-coenzyme A ligase family protein n=1 Tax=Mycolicibacterium brisbanense TaxID=146020 RepID=A0A100W747_9MYCO|nr:phenylacetate-coenzyme A ligase family protein [Mycolicibacterium brisbanense]